MREIIKTTWLWESNIGRDVECDKFYDPRLGRVVDLGWDELVNSVNRWISSYNVVNGKIFGKYNKIVTSVRFNSETEKRLMLYDYYYYDNLERKYYDKLNRKLSTSVDIIIDNNFKDNNIYVYVGDDIYGEIIIDYKNFKSYKVDIVTPLPRYDQKEVIKYDFDNIPDDSPLWKPGKKWDNNAKTERIKDLDCEVKRDRFNLFKHNY